MKIKVQLRNGKTVEVDKDAPPTPLATQEELVNPLLYMRDCTLAVKGVQCEKYLIHNFDGTVATHMLRWKFKKGIEHTSVLCDDCALELMAEYAPYGNTGLTDNNRREGG